MRPRAAAFVVALALVAASRLAAADPADYVSTPAVEFGERELEFRYGSASGPGDSRTDAGSVALGYGATQWWFTEVYVKFERSGGETAHFDAVEWENKFSSPSPANTRSTSGCWSKSRSRTTATRVTS